MRRSTRSLFAGAAAATLALLVAGTPANAARSPHDMLVRPGHAAARPAAASLLQFGVSGTNVQIVVDAPHGVTPRGFGTQYCAWHDQTTVNGAPLPFTNMPYVSDAGASCGANFVATGGTGVSGATEGVTIVGGHEYAETPTDPA